MTVRYKMFSKANNRSGGCSNTVDSLHTLKHSNQSSTCFSLILTNGILVTKPANRLSWDQDHALVYLVVNVFVWGAVEGEEEDAGTELPDYEASQAEEHEGHEPAGLPVQSSGQRD